MDRPVRRPGRGAAPDARLKSRRRGIAALLGVAIATGMLGFAEKWQRDHELGSMRVWFDPPGIKYVLDPSQEDRGRGWREDRTPPPRTPGVPRLVCLGDSVTYGVSVAARDTWCEVVRRGLGKVEAFNFGMNGWDAEQVATLLESRVAAWDPDVVVWGTYVNDVFPTYLLYGMETGEPVFVGTDVPERARILPEGLSLFLVRHSALFRRLQGAAYARSEKQSGALQARPGWYESQLDRVLAWGPAHDTPVVVLAIAPHAMSNMETCPQQFPVANLCDVSLGQYRTITAALEARNATWVDGLAAFQASGRPHYHPEGRLDPDHPNAAGHRVLGLAALPTVRAALALPEPQAGEEVPVPEAPDGPRHGGRHPDRPRVEGGGRRGRDWELPDASPDP